jgi:hypothetical protein
MKKQFAQYTYSHVIRSADPKMSFATELVTVEVEVMTIAKSYAMVRRKGCAPFVVSLKELKMIEGKGKS